MKIFRSGRYWRTIRTSDFYWTCIAKEKIDLIRNKLQPFSEMDILLYDNLVKEAKKIMALAVTKLII